MPVDDHPVHDRVVQKSDAKYGCWNLPRERKQLLVKDGWSMTYVGSGMYESVQRWRTIDDFGSLDCRYDGKGGLTEHDKLCLGCDHYLTSDYVKKIIGN